MHRYLFLTVLLTAAISSQAQNVKTGIGTTTPQQALEVAYPAGTPSTSTAVGTTGVNLVKPTIRVEGLNYSNNTANVNNASSLKRVYANQSGDLVLVNSSLENVNIQQFGDAIPAKTITLLVAGTLASSLKSQTFTLTQPSIVYFSASVGVTLRTTLLSAALTDGGAKVYGAYFQFSSAPAGVSTTATFGNNKKTYTESATGVSGDFVLNPRSNLVLPAGAYTVNLIGEINGISLLFSTDFGVATTGENFIINAIPTKY